MDEKVSLLEGALEELIRVWEFYNGDNITITEALAENDVNIPYMEEMILKTVEGLEEDVDYLEEKNMIYTMFRSLGLVYPYEDVEKSIISGEDKTVFENVPFSYFDIGDILVDMYFTLISVYKTETYQIGISIKFELDEVTYTLEKNSYRGLLRSFEFGISDGVLPEVINYLKFLMSDKGTAKITKGISRQLS